MATVNQILDNIRYGEDYTKKKALKEGILKCYDKDLDIFYASNRIKNIANELTLDEAEEMKVNRLISKLELLEGRLETGKPMTEAYKKMQSTAIMEDCKALQNEVTKTRKVESRKLEGVGKIIAATKYFVENTIDDKAMLKESTNILLNKYIKEEKDGIEEVF